MKSLLWKMVNKDMNGFPVKKCSAFQFFKKRVRTGYVCCFCLFSPRLSEMLLHVCLGSALGFVTQSSAKAELLVSGVRVNPDPALAQIYFGGGGADGKEGVQRSCIGRRGLG